MPVVKKEIGSAKKPQPASPRKPITPISKPVKAVTPAPKQPGKPAPTGTQVQGGQAGTAKPKPQTIPTTTAKSTLPKAAPLKPAKPQLINGKPALKPVSLRYEQEVMNNPMLKKIDRKMKEHPDLFGAVVRGSDSLEKAFNKMFAMWGKDEEMDAHAISVLERRSDIGKQQEMPSERKRTTFPNQITIPPIPGLEQGLLPPETWSDYQQIVDRLPYLLELNERWNPDGLIPDDVFLSIMIVATHEEARLRRQNIAGELNPIMGLGQLVGAMKDGIGDIAALFGVSNDISLGVANIRPATVNVFYDQRIFVPPDRALSIPNVEYQEENGNLRPYIDLVLPSAAAADALASYREQYENDPIETLMLENVSFEFMAAQVYVATQRAIASGLEPTLANIAAYMNQGVQTPAEFETLQNHSPQEYGYVVDHINRTLLSALAIGENPQAFGLDGDPWLTFSLVNPEEADYLSYDTSILIWERYRVTQG